MQSKSVRRLPGPGKANSSGKCERVLEKILRAAAGRQAWNYGRSPGAWGAESKVGT